MDHGLGDVEASLVIAHQAAPAGKPRERSLDHPAAGQDPEARLVVDTAHDLDDEVKEGVLVHHLGAIIGAIGEEMFEPGPALADGVEDHLGSSGVGYVCGGEIDHQEAAISIDHDVAFAANYLLAGIVAALGAWRWRLDRLAVDNPAGRARLAALLLAIHHQRDVVDSAKQEQPHETAEPPINRLPGWEVLRQHPPAAAGANQIADGIDHLAQIDLSSSARLGWLRKQWLYPRPFLFSQVGRVTLGFLLDFGHAATIPCCPHRQFESRPEPKRNPFSNGLSAARNAGVKPMLPSAPLSPRPVSGV